MKKFLALALALVMICALSVTCFAARIDNNTKTDSAEVKVTYVDGAGAGPTYAVDVVWGDLNFTYTQSAQRWDEVNHVEVDAATSAWNKTSADIEVRNHSNASVWVTVAYAAKNGVADGALFSISNGNLGELTRATAGAENYTKDTATLNVSGVPSETIGTNTVVGTVTVTFATTAPADPS